MTDQSAKKAGQYYSGKLDRRGRHPVIGNCKAQPVLPVW